ncbi:MAG TPA: GTP cyclohydrolase I [Candidatus Thermoplasmatota archaeon]
MSPARRKPTKRAASRAKAPARAPGRKSPARRRPGTPDIPALDRFLRSLGVDPGHDEEYSLTAPLLADLLHERTAGLREDPPTLRPLPYRGHPGETVAIEGIHVYGLCPHHLVPYFGEATVRFIPRNRLCGAGALVRAIRALANVPRLQEDLTQEIADMVERSLAPRGVYVHMAARHLCMELRGAEGRARLVTEARRGEAPRASEGPSSSRRR